MPIKFSDNDWEYWVIQSYWNQTEAAFILEGIIPSGWNFNEYGFNSEERPSIEPGLQTCIDLIERNFSEKKITPKDLLSWAMKSGIILNSELCEAGQAQGIIDFTKNNHLRSNESMPIKEKKSGQHFLGMRVRILNAALRYIDNPSLVL